MADLTSLVSIDMQDCTRALSATYSLDQGSADFSGKALSVPVTTTRVSHCSEKAAMHKTTNGLAVFQ